jgi:ATP-dependent Lhr-like helicase
MDPALQLFLPPIARWFDRTLGTPTPPQRLGWPVLDAGESCLILAPTGSGKTLAAFLLAIDRVARTKLAAAENGGGGDAGGAASKAGGVKILYVSPLKSLVNDMEKNLRQPLEQIATEAQQMGAWGGAENGGGWPEIRVALRTGDTPSKVRAALVRRPPDILLTTPESLNLMLTSGAQRILTEVQYVIVDEVHALAGNKRGVFLSLLLERLEHLRRTAADRAAAADPVKVAPGVYLKRAAHVGSRPLVRIGLSATARPADQIALWLGGYERAAAGGAKTRPRPVRIVDTQQRKKLDVRIVCPWGGRGAEGEVGVGGAVVADLLEDPEGGGRLSGGGGGRSHWPAVATLLKRLVREHRGTLVFANSRRLVERIVRMLDDQNADAPASEEADAGTRPTPTDRSGQLGALRALKILPHHGSISKEVRLATEQALKMGQLDAVVTTSSLELGIDIGMLDLVVQIDSPGTVAAALQRVGRAGHLEKATAKGRLVPRMAADLPALAALTPMMLAGEVEPVTPIRNALDVLAQQIAAIVVAGGGPSDPDAKNEQSTGWDRTALVALVRQSSAYVQLPEDLFNRVLEMLAPPRGWDAAFVNAGVRAPLRPRLSWDRANDRVRALPGTARVVVMEGGVISDTGQFPVFVGDSRVRLGELDEEFVFESRAGDRIALGAQMWTIERIEDDRVIVAPGGGRGTGGKGFVRLPFWKGESAPRSLELGAAIARTLEELETRAGRDPAGARRWLKEVCAFDDNAADELLSLRERQIAAGSCMPHARRIVVEHFVDKTGEPLLAVISPLGARVHHVLHLALESIVKRQGIPAQILHTDDGLLIRTAPEHMEPLANVLELLSPATLEADVRGALEDSSLFGLRFRQNAARALLLPRPSPRKRTPLWQQRLRARHLLALVKGQPNFPVVLETYREILQDALALDAARSLLERLGPWRGGEGEQENDAIEVCVCQTRQPSPLVRTLWWNFEQVFMYQWDEPLGKAGGAGGGAVLSVDHAVLDAALGQGDAGEAGGTRRVNWGAEDRALLRRRVTGSDLPARDPEELLEKIAWAGPVAAEGGSAPDDPAWRAWVRGDPEPWLAELLAARRLVLVDWPTGGEKGQGAAPETGYRWLARENLPLVARALEATAPVRLSTWQRVSTSAAAGMEGVAWRRVPVDPEAWEGGGMGEALAGYPGSPRQAREMLIAGALRQAVGMTRAGLARTLGIIAAALPDMLTDMLARRMIIEMPATMLAPDVAAELARKDGPAAALLLLPDQADELQALALRRNRQQTPTVDVAALQRHLLRWHGIRPAPQRGSSERITPARIEHIHDALELLWPLAFELSVWQQALLPARLAGWVPRGLEDAVASGYWVPVGVGDELVAFMPRELLMQRPLPAAEEAGSAAAPDALAAAILGHLAKFGASYQLDLQMSTGADVPALASALRHLFAVGQISNDQLASIARLKVLAEDVGSQGGTRPGMGWESGRYPAGLAGDVGVGRRLRPRGSGGFEALVGGRWYLLPPRADVAVAESPLQRARGVAGRVERLLERHGFAGRELCRAAIDGPWREAYALLTRMEWAGNVRRGYFVEGLRGVQFMLPRVTLAAGSAAAASAGFVWLSMLDPANVYAALERGTAAGEQWRGGESLRLPRVAGSLVAVDVATGRAVLGATSWGQTLIALTTQETLVAAALEAVPALLDRLGPERHGLLVRNWQPASGPPAAAEGPMPEPSAQVVAIIGSPAEPILRRVGFGRDAQGLRLYRGYR